MHEARLFSSLIAFKLAAASSSFAVVFFHSSTWHYRMCACNRLQNTNLRPTKFLSSVTVFRILLVIRDFADSPTPRSCPPRPTMQLHHARHHQRIQRKTHVFMQKKIVLMGICALTACLLARAGETVTLTVSCVS
jgi:hypothetical protein